MNRRFWPLTGLLTLAAVAAHSGGAAALDRHKPVQPKKVYEAAGAGHHRTVALKKRGHKSHDKVAHRPAPSADASSKPAVPPLSGDLAAVKNAIDLMRKAKTAEATAIEKTIGDPAAQKLVEWFILRHSDSEAGFRRYATFIADNLGWPSMGLLRRRAEARL